MYSEIGTLLTLIFMRSSTSRTASGKVDRMTVDGAGKPASSESYVEWQGE